MSSSESSSADEDFRLDKERAVIRAKWRSTWTRRKRRPKSCDDDDEGVVVPSTYQFALSPAAFAVSAPAKIQKSSPRGVEEDYLLPPYRFDHFDSDQRQRRRFKSADHDDDDTESLRRELARVVRTPPGRRSWSPVVNEMPHSTTWPRLSPTYRATMDERRRQRRTFPSSSGSSNTMGLFSCCRADTTGERTSY
mmetsp:Transcript_11192/g.36982  ORF Transcript_11192/g.36982 Transcript_11192/m.36982 type:complete len:194 (-) Transcript_11192:601-1182(-)